VNWIQVSWAVEMFFWPELNWTLVLMKKGPKKVKTDLLKTTEENEIYLDYYLFKYSLLNITSSSSSSNIESGALLGLF